MAFIKRNLATLSKTPFNFLSAAGKPLSGIQNKPLSAAKLQFKSGEEFIGKSFGSEKAAFTAGEVVFTTSIVGYPESMTDPSYHGQILVFTQPIIGNYGVPPPTIDRFGLLKHFESEKIQVSGIVVNDYAAKYSHWNAIESLGQWCARSGVPAITGIDTREVVTLLRNQGSKLGAIATDDVAFSLDDIPEKVDSSSWIQNVSTKGIKIYNSSGFLKIALIDCGAKQNIIRCIAEGGAEVTVFPYDFDFSPSLADYDGVFISNGPGDPLSATATTNVVSKIVAKSAGLKFPIPIFGICMGHQILGRSVGYKTYKMPFGNRGHNQPCNNLITGGCVITSQNHGYALDDTNAPTGWKTFFRNANDGSNEGIIHESLPFSSVQFHPEAMGGPLDTRYLFDDFLMSVKMQKKKRDMANPFYSFVSNKTISSFL